MERWGVSVNGYFGSAGIYRERAPWWVFAAEAAVSRVCGAMPRWRVPLVGRIRSTPRWEDESYTVDEYYGDTMASLTHCLICAPVTEWCYRRYVTTSVEM